MTDTHIKEAWRGTFRRNIKSLGRKTTHGGEKKDRTPFGYSTEVDWLSVESFIEKELSQARKEGQEAADHTFKEMMASQDEARAEGYQKGLTFTLEHYSEMERARERIQECEGKHTQQVAYSTFHDALTQICFTCQIIRTSMYVKE